MWRYDRTLPSGLWTESGLVCCSCLDFLSFLVAFFDAIVYLLRHVFLGGNDIFDHRRETLDFLQVLGLL